MLFGFGSSESMRIRSNGNVGIGLTSIVAKLQVENASSADPTSLSSVPTTNVFGMSTSPGGMLAAGIGTTGGTHVWLQGRNVGGAGVSYPISLQPLGGNVGIGTSSPLARLQVGNGTQTAINGADNKIHIATTATRSALLTLANSSGGTTVEGQFESSAETADLRIIIGSTTNHDVVFRTNNVERMRLSSAGVKFQNGSSSLNYYEEGSWTPALQNATVSYSDRSGSYVRIGNYVFVRWGFRISSISGQSGTLTIAGLPFTSVSWGSYQEPNISVSTGALSTADNAFRARVFVGGGSSSLFGRIANNGDTAWNTSDLQNGSWVIGEIYYNVS
jgi:hypothetical protein